MPTSQSSDPSVLPSTPSREAAVQVGKYLILSSLPARFEEDLCEAYDPALDRRVLLVRLHDEPAWQDALELARLEHPYILRVVDVSAPPPTGFGYVTFALPSGGTLRQRLVGGRAGQGFLLTCLWQVGNALLAAHALGFVHRGLDADAVMFGGSEQAQVRGFVPIRSAAARCREPENDLQDFIALVEQTLGKPRWIRRRQQMNGPVSAQLSAILTQLQQRSQRSRRGRWIVAVLAAVIALSGLFGVRHFQALHRCPPLEQDAKAVWSGSRASAVHQALVRTGKPYSIDAARRVAERVDAYLSRFTSMKPAICEPPRGAGQVAESVRDLRISCMQEQLRKLDATLRVLEEADIQTAERAVALVGARLSVTELESCLQLTPDLWPPPPSLDRASEVARARAVMGRGEALVHAGKFQAADTLFEQARRIAEETHYAPVQAEAALSSGESARRLGAFANSVDWLHRAATIAEGCRHDRVAAQAWLTLMFVVGDRQAALGKAADYIQYTEASLHRCQHCGDLWPNFHERLGHLRSIQGQVSEALRLHTKALAERKRLRAPATDLMRSYSSLGNVYEGLERTAEAIDFHTRAVVLAEAELGSSHPQVAVYLSNLAKSQEAKGQLAAAQKNIERALDITLRSLGPEHPNVARNENVLGGILMEQGHNAEARDYLTRAIVHHEKNRAIGPRHPQLAIVFVQLGTLEQREGHAKAALAAFTRALHIYEAAYPPTHLDLVFAILGMARAHIALKDQAAAKVMLERARYILDHSEEQQAMQQETRAALWFTEALYLVLLNKLRAPDLESRHMAERARALYQALGDGYRYELAEVERFLAQP